MSRKILIVGGVAGGATAAARLRRLDEKAKIIIFERGPYISFANCGLPYHIGKVIKNRRKLLVQTSERFKTRFNIDVRVNNEVTAINRQRKLVEVKDLATGRTYQESYDKLVLSPGAEPVRPPIEGINSDGVFTLRNIPDMDAIIDFLDRTNPQRAVVVGASYIGLEMAENLSRRGLRVAVVEMLNQVMPTMDKEMAAYIHQHLCEKNIATWLGDAVSAIRQEAKGLKVVLKSSTELPCDLVILAVGVRPETHLAEKAGLQIGTTGGIKVNQYLQTSDPDIYAIGDAIEVTHFVLGTPCLIPLAGPANRQGRIAADNICDRNVSYEGTQGTAVLKVFDITAAMTGASEKALKKANIGYEKIYIHPANHAGYYPGAEEMHIKVLFTRPEGKLLGAQIVGGDGVDKRIDVLATALRAGFTIFDLQKLELAYAPPYGNAKDPVNMVGFVAGNVLDGTVDVGHFEQLGEEDFILDVRTSQEASQGMLPNAVNICVDELRQHLEELPRDKDIHVYCLQGLRSYISCRILSQNGFKAKNLSGGYKSYRAAVFADESDRQIVGRLQKQFLEGT